MDCVGIPSGFFVCYLCFPKSSSFATAKLGFRVGFGSPTCRDAYPFKYSIRVRERCSCTRSIPVKLGLRFGPGSTNLLVGIVPTSNFGGHGSKTESQIHGNDPLQLQDFRIVRNLKEARCRQIGGPDPKLSSSFAV